MVKRAFGEMMICVGALALGLCLIASVAEATVKPGDVIAPSTAPQVKELVSPGVYWPNGWRAGPMQRY